MSLTAVMEGRAQYAHMVDRDPDVAAFWRTVLEHNEDLIKKIDGFVPTIERVEKLSRDAPNGLLEHGFRTLVLNRTRRGGVLAPGATFIKYGEGGQGITSRWYPKTLKKRLREIAEYKSRLRFEEGDGVRAMETFAERHRDVRFFVDPPYTAAGGKRAGSRLYTHNEVDHQRIFSVLEASKVDFLMTYDYCQEIADLVNRFKFHAVEVKMKNSHHDRIAELVITRDPLF